MKTRRFFSMLCAVTLSPLVSSAYANGFEEGCDDGAVGYRWVSNYQTVMRAEIINLDKNTDARKSILLHCGSNIALIVSGDPRGLRAFEKMALAKRMHTLENTAHIMRKSGSKVLMEKKSTQSCLCSKEMKTSALDVFAATRPHSQGDNN